MVVRAVEWKLPYTGWKAIEITNRKVVNLRLRDENNLIIYDAGDNEIYTDLQLWDEIRPSSEFPVWANVGRAIEDNGWDTTGTLVCFKTTSGDNIKLLYADNWKLFIDNGTWTFKQIYLKSEVDALLALKQDLLTAGDNITIDQNNVISASCPKSPVIQLEVDDDWSLISSSGDLVDWCVVVVVCRDWLGNAHGIIEVWDWEYAQIIPDLPSTSINWFTGMYKEVDREEEGEPTIVKQIFYWNSWTNTAQ